MLKLFALLALAGALVVAGSSAFAAGPQTITGTDGPGFTITLKQHSRNVLSLPPATYLFVISDKSNIHNFHLIGPGVNKKTSVSGTGTKTWTIKLKKGKYTYQCDIHAAVGMKGTFRVT